MGLGASGGGEGIEGCEVEDAVLFATICRTLLACLVDLGLHTQGCYSGGCPLLVWFKCGGSLPLLLLERSLFLQWGVGVASTGRDRSHGVRASGACGSKGRHDDGVL